MIRNQWKAGAALGLSVLLVACAAPPPSDQLLLARSEYRAIENNPEVARSAARQLAQAQQALEKAEAKHKSGADSAIVNHYAYLAETHAKTAREQAAHAALQIKIAKAEEDRKEMMLQARTSQAQEAEERAELLKRQLEELQAKETDRGTVVTLGDVLFDLNKADLKSGSMRTIDKLAGILEEHPQRRVRIEGYTDSTGDEQYNLNLSERRANAVKRALTHAGISSDRIEVAGYGEDYPVADNSSSSGRQQNRRVEVVLSEPDGEFKTQSRR